MLIFTITVSIHLKNPFWIKTNFFKKKKNIYIYIYTDRKLLNGSVYCYESYI